MSASITRRLGAALGTVFGVAALAAGSLSCASIPPTNYYVLGLPREGNAPIGESNSSYTVSIAPFESEPAYMRKKIVWRSESNRMGYYSYEKWGALPAEMFAFRMYERAHGSGLFESVRSEGSRKEADLFIGGRIIAFEELDAADGLYGKVEVEIELSDGEGKIIWSGVENHTTPASERSVEAVVEAIADAADAVITKALVSIGLSLEERLSREERMRREEP